MNDKKQIDVSHIQFTSTVFPTKDDIKLWDSLSSAEQWAVTMHRLNSKEANTISPSEPMEKLIARVRAK